MLLGTVRREALRLMFVSYEDVTEASTIVELFQNPRYAPYLAGMEMSINRGILRMRSMGLLPPKRLVLGSPDTLEGQVATYDLSRIPDWGSVTGLMCQTSTCYTAHAYRWEGGTTLVVPLYCDDCRYVLLYQPRLVPLTPLMPDDTPLPVPEELACLIPYYVKSELYEEEDPAAARTAREYFELGLAAHRELLEQPVQAVTTKYGWEVL